MAPAAKNGPKGIICSEFFFNRINDIGKPISEPKKIEKIVIG